MRWVHCTRAALAAGFVAVSAAAQSPALDAQQSSPAGPGSNLLIFFRGNLVGSEQSAVARSAEGWTITASGRVGPPFDIVTRRLEVRYDANWKATELTLEGTAGGQAQSLHTTVSGNAIRNELTTGAQPTVTTVSAGADVLLPGNVFAPYEALAARLTTAAAGSTMAGYAASLMPITIRVDDVVAEKIQTGAQLIDTRHSHITMTPTAGGSPVQGEVWADANGRLLRLSIPAQAIEVAREDVASVAARQVPISRPNDEQVKVPSNGFSLAGTLSKPAGPPPAGSNAGRMPGVVFVGGAGAVDRDEQIAGIPIQGQLAGIVADAGFVTLRYDKRGVGQSGGRFESASISDLADDLRAAVKLLADRKDVDPRRIAIVGHSEGGSVALLAGSKDKRIAAVALIAAAGISGSDLVLEQQAHALGRSTMTDAQKQEKVALQKRINQAAISGRGWEQLPPEARVPVDNAEFQSLLENDPARVMPDVRQPLLILQGDLDAQVAPINADRLEALARTRKNAPGVEVVKVPGVNHLLVPAATGEVDEYGALKDRHVSPAVSTALVAWLQKVLAVK